MYNNQKQVDEIEKQVKDISPDLRLSGFRTDGRNNVIGVTIKFPVKGNADLIKKLEHIGFRKTWRERSRDMFDIGYASTREKGYYMIQEMSMNLRR